MREDGIDGYKKIRSLDELVDIADENGGELDFVIPRQIATFDIEMIKIKYIILQMLQKVKIINLYIPQWKKDKYSVGNHEKEGFVELRTSDDNKYYIGFQSKSQLKKNIKIGFAEIKGSDGEKYYIAVQLKPQSKEDIKIEDVYLDGDKIIKMAKEPGLEYMREPLEYLIQNKKTIRVKVNTEKGEEIRDVVNILDYWGVRTLRYIHKVSNHVFRIDEHEIKNRINEFNDIIKLENEHKYSISGYESTFKCKDTELRFRIFDASHIYEGEDRKYKEENKEYKEDKEGKINSYIALAAWSGSGVILLDEDFEKPSVDEKIKNLIRDATKITGYNILTFVVDEQKLIEEGIIGEKDYTKIIRENEIPYVIDIIKKYGI